MVQKILITPFQRFVRIESASGLLLFGSTLLALVLANSQASDWFLGLWNYKFGFSSPDLKLVKPLILWINDGLMAIFFFLIGLEIKRELLIGELNSLKKASFPLMAAVGGMLVPVGLFFALNRNPDASSAWGIPMATDIAFSLAILQLLGKRVPIGLKVFLTAFAIVDDLGAVMIIAVFYNEGIQWGLLGVALALLAVLYFLSYKNIYAKQLLFILSVVVWVLFLKSGIHPTIAGVLLAFAVPIRKKMKMGNYVERLCELSDTFEEIKQDKGPLLTGKQIEVIDTLEDWTDQVQSPLQQLEHRLHNWVAFLIMPVFALSNSGVPLFTGEGGDGTLSGVIALSLVGGKFLGVLFFAWLAVKLRISDLPAGVRFSQIMGVALLAGVGFTMSIFVANLAFATHPELLDSAKTGILAASFGAGLLGYLVLRFTSTATE